MLATRPRKCRRCDVGACAWMATCMCLGPLKLSARSARFAWLLRCLVLFTIWYGRNRTNFQRRARDAQHTLPDSFRAVLISHAELTGGRAQAQPQSLMRAMRSLVLLIFTYRKHKPITVICHIGYVMSGASMSFGIRRSDSDSEDRR